MPSMKVILMSRSRTSLRLNFLPLTLLFTGIRLIKLFPKCAEQVKCRAPRRMSDFCGGTGRIVANQAHLVTATKRLPNQWISSAVQPWQRDKSTNGSRIGLGSEPSGAILFLGHVTDPG